jgi:DNA-binding NtrC family response regulator
MARVLVLDDDPGIREAVTALLQLADHEVRTIPDLPGGLRLLKAEAFDLVVTDLFSRRLTPEAFAPVQALHAAAPELPIVLATAYAEAGDVNPAAAGLADIILKPFDIDDFLARLHRVLSENCAQAPTGKAQAFKQ